MDESSVYTCLIVDDDEVDRLTVLAHARLYPFLKVAGVFERPEQAIQHLESETVDILFLDIEMPGLSGLDLRKRLLSVPVCIFITSFADFATESFDADALDFLLKPFSRDRFARAIERARQYLGIREKATLLDHALGQDTVIIKEGHERTKVRLHDILYLEALKDYTGVVTEGRRYLVLGSLGSLLQESAFQSFIRIHRSYAVQRHFIRKVDSNNVYVQTVSLPLGKTFRRNVESLFE